MRQQEHTPQQSPEAFGQHILPSQTPGCKVILDDVRLIVVVAELAVQTPVTQVEFTEGGQADEAAGPGAAPVPVAEGLQANNTLLGGRCGVLLTLHPPVGHVLEAADARGMASLQDTPTILGCHDAGGS